MILPRRIPVFSTASFSSVITMEKKWRLAKDSAYLHEGFGWGCFGVFWGFLFVLMLRIKRKVLNQEMEVLVGMHFRGVC